MSSTSIDVPLSPNDSVRRLRGVGEVLASHLAKLDLVTIHDLVSYWPKQYNDRRSLTPIAELTADSSATIAGVVTHAHWRRARQKRMHVLEVILRDTTDSVGVIWFNQPFLKNTITIGKHLRLHGKIKRYRGQLVLSNPEYESAEASESVHTQGIIPTYHLTAGVTQKQLRRLIQQAVQIMMAVPDYLPSQIRDQYNLLPRQQAYQWLHFPPNQKDLRSAQRRFVFDGLYLTQCASRIWRAQMASHIAPAFPPDIAALKHCVAQLPFALTTAQRRCAWEIIQDMGQSHPMQRLLQGEVGSGKTIVAALAALTVIQHGYQVAVMAPTTILAQQLATNLERILKPFQVSIYLRIQQTTKSEPVCIMSPLTVGTHALIQPTVQWHKLGLVIIDEQHRFGVQQRKLLTQQTSSDQMPHLLSMTATPIPRSLALTWYGEIDLSIINELPHGRKPIITTVIDESKRMDAEQLIEQRIAAGEQVFVVCPLIEATTNNEKKTVAQEAERLHIRFPHARIAQLHGRMKPTEKTEIMEAMRNQRLDIVVSTSVVEVGVDVPNATIMVVEGAESFGIAQLHQFRGRVGRSDKQSYCILISRTTNTRSAERLAALAALQSGLELSTVDAGVRGIGDLYGTAQSGLIDIFIHAKQFPAIFTETKEAARTTIKQSLMDQYPALATLINERLRSMHLE